MRCSSTLMSSGIGVGPCATLEQGGEELKIVRPGREGRFQKIAVVDAAGLPARDALQLFNEVLRFEEREADLEVRWAGHRPDVQDAFQRPDIE